VHGQRGLFGRGCQVWACNFRLAGDGQINPHPAEGG